jgi:PAS domain S-box-containing protein
MLNSTDSLQSEAPFQSIFEAAGDGLVIVDRLTGNVVEANPAAGAMHGYSREELIGLPAIRLMRPDYRASFSQYAQVMTPDIYEPIAVHLRKDGTSFHAEVCWTSFTYQSQACLLGVVRDATTRVEAARLLKHEVEIHALEQASLLAISKSLAFSLELKPTEILDQLRVVLDYTHAGLFAVQESTLIALAVRGTPQLEHAMPFGIPLPNVNPPVMLLNGEQPNRIADVWSTDPSAQALRSLLNDQGAMLLEGVRAWLWVPLTAKGRVIGGLSATHAEPDYFTAHHADLALIIANQAAITMINAQLYEQAQALAKLQERQHLAQELHDAVNQSLFSAGLIADVLPRLWERNPAEGRRSLEDLRRLTRGALAEMRGLLAELRPAVLTGTELGDLLRQLGNALTGRVNVPVSVNVVGQGALPPDVQVALYRLCREALSNIAKHAMAEQVTIHLQYDPGTVELVIRDDGRGFDQDQAPAGHSGLGMMHERAEEIGAELSVTSELGQGTSVTVRWSETRPREAV